MIRVQHVFRCDACDATRCEDYEYMMDMPAMIPRARDEGWRVVRGALYCPLHTIAVMVDGRAQVA